MGVTFPQLARRRRRRASENLDFYPKLPKILFVCLSTVGTTCPSGQSTHFWGPRASAGSSVGFEDHPGLILENLTYEHPNIGWLAQNRTYSSSLSEDRLTMVLVPRNRSTIPVDERLSWIWHLGRPCVVPLQQLHKCHGVSSTLFHSLLIGDCVSFLMAFAYRNQPCPVKNWINLPSVILSSRMRSLAEDVFGTESLESRGDSSNFQFGWPMWPKPEFKSTFKSIADVSGFLGWTKKWHLVRGVSRRIGGGRVLMLGHKLLLKLAFTAGQILTNVQIMSTNLVRMWQMLLERLSNVFRTFLKRFEIPCKLLFSNSLLILLLRYLTHLGWKTFQTIVFKNIDFESYAL